MQLKRVLGLLVLSAGLSLSAAAQDAQPSEQSRAITLEEAIDMALRQNFDVQIERLNPAIERYRLNSAYSAYDPTFSLSGSQNRRKRSDAVTDVTLGFQQQTGEFWDESYQTGLGGLTPTGMRYNLSANLNRNSGKTAFSSNGVNFVLDRPFQYTSFVGVSVTQPLLRNFLIDGPRANIAIAKKQIGIAESVYRLRVMQIVNLVETAYYNLIFARESVKVQQKALELVEQLLRENKKRVEVGAMAPLDEKQAESRVATTRAQLIEAQRSLDAQENILKNLITDKYSDLHAINLIPAESLVPVVEGFDLQESWRHALAGRPELQQTRFELEQWDIRLKYNRNQRLPSLDLEGSYGLSGVDRDLGPTIADLRKFDNPSYGFGASLSYPIGNRSARNAYRISKEEKQKAILRLKALEQDVMVEVDDAIKRAQSSFQRVHATRAAREFAEAALLAEQKKLENGKSTSFFVLQFQNDLTAARFEEIRALAEYNIALASLALREGTTFDKHQLNVTVK